MSEYGIEGDPISTRVGLAAWAANWVRSRTDARACKASYRETAENVLRRRGLSLESFPISSAFVCCGFGAPCRLECSCRGHCAQLYDKVLSKRAINLRLSICNTEVKKISDNRVSIGNTHEKSGGVLEEG